jgi:GalNAc-alpha-(1->4)-GalNAc-alpha-(1->3)-diNAcBac-PP-undecaprenol alpha-1,4-N-acetyl-D-galactosaminyltransferase
MTDRPTKVSRILFAVSSLSAGGAERMIVELANAFVARDKPVAVLTFSSAANDHYVLRPEVERIPLNLMWISDSVWHSLISNVRRSRTIRSAVLRFRPDVVVSFVDQTNVRILAALAGTGIPVIVSERIDPRRYPIGRSWDWARRLLYPLARAVVVQSQSVANWAKGRVPARRIHVLPNFVRDLPPAPVRTQQSSDTILAVGRLDRQKGFDLLIRAFASSALAGRGVRLTILGKGTERDALLSLARELEVEHSVSLPGVVEDPENWMARATVFALPSRYEGFPNVLLEAMAMGCAVIAADCDSGPRDIVRNGVDGLLVPVEDVAALADSLGKLFEDASLRDRLSAAAVSVRERYKKEPILRRWELLIGGVLSR